jgi:hypothetical protein
MRVRAAAHISTADRCAGAGEGCDGWGQGRGGH